jgi:DNA-binding NarL/FixJ family response regulator
MVRRHEPVRHFEMVIRTEGGESLSASFSVLLVAGARPSRYTLIHLFQPVNRRAEVDDLVRKILAASPAPALPESTSEPSVPKPQVALTAREVEILHLLSDGTSTRQIADTLFISVTTTRNHIQNILRKLEAHSKLEAVAQALRQHLL